jgi:hypothetical protein
MAHAPIPLKLELEELEPPSYKNRHKNAYYTHVFHDASALAGMLVYSI